VDEPAEPQRPGEEVRDGQDRTERAVGLAGVRPCAFQRDDEQEHEPGLQAPAGSSGEDRRQGEGQRLQPEDPSDAGRRRGGDQPARAA